jgi:hypothetical protein
LRNSWIAFFLALHIATGFFLWGILRDFHFVDPSLLADVNSEEKANVLNLAVQIGRLDFVSAILAMFGILVGLAAIFGIVEVRNRAEERARLTAKEIAENVAIIAAREEVQRSLPSIVRREALSVKMFSEGEPSDSEINDLMSKLDKNGDNK